MNTCRRTVARAWLLTALIPAGHGLAQQHVDVLPYNDAGAIKTGKFDFDINDFVLDVRLFAEDMTFVEPTFHGTGAPGFTTGGGLILLPNQGLGFDVSAITVAGGVHNLLYWDGVDDDDDGDYLEDVDFGTPNPGEDMRLFKPLNNTAILDGSSADVPGFEIDITNGAGHIHRHISFQARGPAGTPPSDGLFLIALTMNMAGLDDSAPTYLLFNGDYLRDGDDEIIFIGDLPQTNSDSETAAIAWIETNLLGATAVLLGDANNDLQVTGADLIAVQQNFGRVGPPHDGTLRGDANDDGQVTGADLISVQQNFGSALLSASSPVPEPTGLALMVVAGCTYLLRR